MLDLLSLKKMLAWEPVEKETGWIIKVTDSSTGKASSVLWPSFNKQAEIDKAYRTMDWLLREPTAEERKRAEDDGPSYNGDPDRPFYTD